MPYCTEVFSTGLLLLLLQLIEVTMGASNDAHSVTMYLNTK